MGMSTKILYVEDNPQNMRLIRRMLETSGYAMLEAIDGSSGLALAARELPALILMDIQLPDIDGTEVTARLKSDPALAHIPIIALTASALYGDRERFIAAGCDGYLAKPVSRKELLTAIHYFLDHAP
jgi:two-component system cell cycle response regulator DivK